MLILGVGQGAGYGKSIKCGEAISQTVERHLLGRKAWAAASDANGNFHKRFSHQEAAEFAQTRRPEECRLQLKSRLYIISSPLF